MKTTSKKEIKPNYQKQIGLGEIQGFLKGENIVFKINIENIDIRYQILGGVFAHTPLQMSTNLERTKLKAYGTFPDSEDAKRRFDLIVKDIDDILKTLGIDSKVKQTSHKPKKSQSKTKTKKSIKLK